MLRGKTGLPVGSEKWLEMLILKRGELDNEYVNCHAMTGLLPYFEPIIGELAPTT